MSLVNALEDELRAIDKEANATVRFCFVVARSACARQLSDILRCVQAQPAWKSVPRLSTRDMLRWRATADSDDEYEQAIDRKEIVNADDDDNDDADDTDDEDCDEDGDFIGNHATLRHDAFNVRNYRLLLFFFEKKRF